MAVTRPVLPTMTAGLCGGVDTDYENKHYFFTGIENKYERFDFDQELYLSEMYVKEMSTAQDAISKSFIKNPAPIEQIIPPFWKTLPESLDFTPLDAAATIRYEYTLGPKDFCYDCSFLFKGSEVRRYLWSDDEPLQPAIPITSLITGLPEHFHADIDGAVTGQAGSVPDLYLFKGDQYAVCHKDGKEKGFKFVRSGNISEDWEGLDGRFSSDIDAVFNIYNYDTSMKNPVTASCVFVKNIPGSKFCIWRIYSWYQRKVIGERH